MVRNLTEQSTCTWEWVDVTDPTEADFMEISDKYKLHPAAVLDSLQPDHLPKYEVINDSIFAIIRVFDKEVGAEGDTVQDLTNKIAIFYGDNFLITVHRLKYPFLEEIKRIFVDTDQCLKPYDLFIQLVKEVLLTFEKPALKLAADLDYFESKVFLRRTYNYPLTNGMYWLKRKAEVSKRILNLSKIVLDNLSREKEYDPNIQDAKDVFLRLLTMYEEIDNSTNNLLNIYIGLASQRTNEIMRVLTIFSVFFLPLTFIVGIYGMNFKYMPELTMRYGYPVVILVMLLITIGIYIWVKKKEWL
ncbi:CorA family divalent cation transporter [Adhaeribacter aquaticus]|uniref:magnesium transporter CorA family protein n=1 Tax=Adhaeribacter aquaticus TaxID=299567 RepID=UPI0003FE27A7|nr:CorA family divalent cation transporter [Adhaeribacter aquaticus]